MPTSNHTFLQPLDLSEVDLKIIALEQKIKALNIEGVDDPQLQHLRNLLLDSHHQAELLLQSCISKYLFKQAAPDYRNGPNGDKAYRLLFRRQVSQLFNEMRFKSKLEMARNFHVVDLDLYEQLSQLNNVRNSYSHPLSHKLELAKDPDRQVYLLELIFSCINSLMEVDRDFHLGGIGP